MATKKTLLFAVLLLSIWSCSSKIVHKYKTDRKKRMYSITDPKQIEVDEIFSLLAYSAVYISWQEDSIPRKNRRGYNIGSILVNENNKPVYHALNCVGVTNNATQHGEVRLITQYLDSVRTFDLKNHIIYTTLEPCAMCAGMMTMTLVGRTVYGQNDVEFSHTFERLAIDSRSIGGYSPFPRKVISDPSLILYKAQLDKEYLEFLEIDSEKYLAKFLVSKKAKEIYKSAYEAFIDYKVKFESNKEIYSGAIQFFNQKINSQTNKL